MTTQGADSARKVPVVIKKYANRRLYNTDTSTYVTLDHLAQMVRDKVDFVVYDAKAGDDITRSVLTQIIFEEESKGASLLPISFLRQLISFYGDHLQALVPQYLDASMQQFARQQEQMRQATQQALGIGAFPGFDEMAKHNMVAFEQALRLFNPFLPTVGPSAKPAAGAVDPEPPVAPEAPPPPPAPPGGLEEMRKALAAMQSQIDAMAKPRKD
jgi:polyhydroxyalkanoate synthesis repressor PhaR